MTFRRSDRPIRVLLWSPRGAGLHYSGPGMTAFRLFSSAVPGRFDLTLVHGNPDQDVYPLFSSQHCLGRIGLGRTGDNVLFIWNGRRWVRRHAGEFDVFYGLQGFHLTVLPAWWAQQRGLPAVVKIAAHREDFADKPGWKRLVALPARRRKMARQLAAIVATSGMIAQELLDYGFPESQIARIPNGVDIATFHPVAGRDEQRQLRQSLGWPDRLTILFSGVIVERKQPLLLVEALGLLRARAGGGDWQLVLAGPAEVEPEYVKHMRQRANDLGVEDAVIWQPFTSDIAPAYRAADIFALPSQSEGMPNALLEAMSCGLPSVVTGISGITDLVEDGVHGLMVEPIAAAIGESLRTYAESTTLRESHGAAARARVIKRYSTQVVLDAYEALFRRIKEAERC